MNLMNNFKSSLFHLMLTCNLAIRASCSGQAIIGSVEQQIDTSLTLIDTLRITIDTQGHSGLIKIIDVGKEQNRIVEIELWNGSRLMQTFRNNQLIYCGSCGRQSSDPYFRMRTNVEATSAFDIILDGEVNTFLVDTANVYLQKIDVLHVSPGEDRYLEWHEIYTPEDFGKVHFTEVTEDLIFRLRDSIITRKLKRFYSRQKH